MFLLDTNVVSELRKVATGRCDPRVLAWEAAIDPKRLFVSVITIQELEQGALSIGRRDPVQGRMLRMWIATVVVPDFADRVLPVDTIIAIRCAALHVPDPRPDLDAMIAATALVHDMAVVTRNIRDFAGTGVRVIDPWQP